MKVLDFRKEARGARQNGREGRGKTRGAAPVEDALHRLGQELPLHLADLRTQAPGKYRDALAALGLGPVGLARLDEQLELLAAATDHDVAAELRRRRAHAEGLHPELRANAERSLGVGLGHVRVYRDPAGADVARRNDAEALAYGEHIVLGPNVSNRPSLAMAEEVAHAAQQRGASGRSSGAVAAHSPVERAAQSAAPAILAGKPASVGRVSRPSVMRVERGSDRAEEREARDLSPQLGSMEARSDDELRGILDDDRGRPRYVKRGYLYEPQAAGSVTLPLWLAAVDERQNRTRGPRGDGSDKGDGGGDAHRAQGESYAPDVAVQRRATGPRPSMANALGVARSGFGGGARPLPYLVQIQRSFGRFDVGAVRAHVGGSAVLAAERLRAEAYAVGENVAFRTAPDLHTAAHEAAHVVQQRRGVSLPGGVSRLGDAYEQHADRVADAVVAGRSAEALLAATSAGSSPHGVQRQEEPAPPNNAKVSLPKFSFGGETLSDVTVGSAITKSWHLGGGKEPKELFKTPRSRIPIAAFPALQLYAEGKAEIQQKANASVALKVAYKEGARSCRSLERRPLHSPGPSRAPSRAGSRRTRSSAVPTLASRASSRWSQQPRRPRPSPSSCRSPTTRPPRPTRRTRAWNGRRSRSI